MTNKITFSNKASTTNHDEQDHISSDVRSTVSNKVATSNHDEQYHISSDVRSPIQNDDEQDHISSDVQSPIQNDDEQDHISSDVQAPIQNDDEQDHILNVGFDSCCPRSYTFEELCGATSNFHEDGILGKGGFGAVYMAVFPDGQTAAVKRVSSASDEGVQAYKAEVTTVSRSNHKHIVRLKGWCHEKGELLVVYEFLENKSLDKHLFDPKMVPLTWIVRYKIAQGSAMALHYLHEECGEHSVLHRDVKSSNILLDPNFVAKLADFGLSRLLDYGKSVVNTIPAGTQGYWAPECYTTGEVRKQSDVHSFGVVLLELATGRKCIDRNVPEDQQVLVKWVQNLHKANRLMEAVDPRLGDYDGKQVEALLTVGLWCVLYDFRERPSMKKIIRILNNKPDPLLDFRVKIPSLVPELVSHHFDLIGESSSGFDSANGHGNGEPRTTPYFPDLIPSQVPDPVPLDSHSTGEASLGFDCSWCVIM